MQQNTRSKHVFITRSMMPSKTPSDLQVWTFETWYAIVSSSPQRNNPETESRATGRATGSQHHISPGRRVSAGLGSGTRSGEPSKGPHMWDRRAGDMKRTGSRGNAHGLIMRGAFASVNCRSNGTATAGRLESGAGAAIAGKVPRCCLSLPVTCERLHLTQTNQPGKVVPRSEARV